MPKLRVESFTISLTGKDTIINLLRFSTILVENRICQRRLTKIAEGVTIDFGESTLKV